jgi:hypothetical protein
MAPDARRSGLGWVILAAALAVPGFLFYNWWSHLKAEHDKGVAAKARSRAAEGSVFQTPPPSARPLGAVNVSTSAAAPGAATAPNVMANAAPTAMPNTMPNGNAAPLAKAPLNPAPNPIGGGPNSGAPAPMNAVSAPSPSAFSAASSTPTASGVAISSAAVLTLSRDPMMSPMDKVRIREAEAEAERNRQAILDAANNKKRPHAVHVKKEPPIESRVELQGIVARPDGDNMAIVNGSTINPGESFAVDGFSSKVKVLKITSSEVTFEYKKQHFKKNVNAE